MIGPFRVGDQPADPIDLTVDRPGSSTPLARLSSATVELVRGDGTTTSWAGTITGNVVRSTMPAGALTTAGQYRIRLVLTGTAGAVERSSWAYFWVRA